MSLIDAVSMLDPSSACKVQIRGRNPRVSPWIFGCEHSFGWVINLLLPFQACLERGNIEDFLRSLFAIPLNLS